MIVGIVGLGLIGGSLVKAYKRSGHKVYAYDIDEKMLEFAKLENNVDEILLPENICQCDLILIALYPIAAIDYLNKNAEYINTNAVVIDCCGTKKLICECGFANAKKYGFSFFGGHPMAGTHKSGYKYSREDMFENAPMVVVPENFDDIESLDKVKQLLSPCRFGSFSVTTAEQHDEMIAFTSQMPHIVSNAFIKSPTAGLHKGFSAGSYKDLTRVAWLNPQMWTELFFENKENVIKELNIFIKSLEEYKIALENDDKAAMRTLLEQGKIRKEEVDGK
ncbi:MAG: prephenate dehydrogenase [Acutalibacteraceae bacterium]